MLLAVLVIAFAITFVGIMGIEVIFVGLIMVLGLVAAGIQQAAGLSEDAVGLIMAIVQIPMLLLLYPMIFAISSIMYVMMGKAGAAAARGETIQIAPLFEGIGRKTAVCTGILCLVLLAMLPAALLLYIPAIYLGLRWSLAFYYVADTNLGVLDCMRASWRATEGKVLDLFVKQLVFGLIAFFGVLFTCYLGIFVIGPLQIVMNGLIYVQLSGRDKSGMPDPDMLAV